MAPLLMSPGPAPRKMNPSIHLKSSLFALATLTKREVVMSIMPNRKTPFSYYNRQNSTMKSKVQQTQLVALAVKTVETEAEKIAHPIFPANFLQCVLIRGNSLNVYSLNIILMFTRHSSSREESQDSQDSEDSEENDKNSREKKNSSNFNNQLSELVHSGFKLAYVS